MVVHLGAHTASEAQIYGAINKEVIWVEVNPELFPQLLQNIQTFSNQRTFCALLGDLNSNNIKFYVAINSGQFSSIFEFGQDMTHKVLSMERNLELEMRRLDHLLGKSDIKVGSHWVVDVQGAELEVIRGSGKLLDNVYSMEIEVSTKD